jgi:sigma-B regulation protein RsbU (phosphoserine phosphatase)
VGIFASLYPAREVGGDLYDFFYIDPGTLCVVVADVSDKGAGAALFMVRTMTLIRTLANLMRGANGAIPAPHEVVARMNEELCEDNPHCMFATVILATLDLGSRQLSYCNAGHPPPYVVGLSGLTMLEAPCETDRYPAELHPMSPARGLEVGDCLFLFTDGVTEALTRMGAFLRVAAGGRASVRGRGQHPERRNYRGRRGPAVRGGAPQSDDIAALAVRLVG